MPTYFVDLDGTIIDPKAGMVESFRSALEEIGHHDDLGNLDLDWIIGPTVISSFERLLGDSNRARDALRLYRHHYVDGGRMFDFVVYSGILEALEALRSPTSQIIICTMKPTAFAKPILDKLDLDYAVLGADLDGRIVRKIQLIDEAMEKFSVNPDESVVVGDRGSDMTAALAANMRPLGVTWGYGTVAELKSAGAARLCYIPRGLTKSAAELACAP